MSRIVKPLSGTPIDLAKPIARGLRHYWSFQEGGGTVVRDLVGGRHGTATNITPASAWVQTTRGEGIDFDGTNDYITCPTIPALSSARQFSILMWADRRAAGTRVGVGNWSGAYSNLVDFLLEPDGIYLEVFTGSFPYGFVAHDQVGLKAYLMVFDGSQSTNAGKLKLYVDGMPIALTYADTVPTASAGNTSAFEMGRAQGAFYSGGLLEEVMIWDRALTAREALSLVVDPNALFTGKSRVAAPLAGGLTAVGNTRSLSYDIYAGVGNSRALSYDLLGAAGNSRGITFNISGTIGNSRSVSFDISGTIGNTRAISYDLRAGIGNSRAVSFDILGAIGNQRSVSYNVSGLAGASRTLSFDILSLAGGSRALSYEIYALTGNTRTLTFDIESALTTVGNSRSLSFNIFAPVSTNRSLSFNIQEAIGNTRTLTYDLYGKAGGTREISFNVHSLAGNSRGLTFDARAIVASTRSISFDVESEIVPYIAGLLEKPLGATFRNQDLGALFRPQSFGAEFQEQNFGAEFNR